MPSRNRSGSHSMERGMTDRSKQFRNWIILIATALLLILIIHLLRGSSPPSDVSVSLLPCTDEDVITPFGKYILYYDGRTLHCITDTGTERWKYGLGDNASFSVSDTHVVTWNSTQLSILDQNGNASYSESLSSEVQFARVGTRYCTAIVGSDTNPTVLIKNLDGTPVDEEYEAFSNMIVLDAGFYGEADQYMWTLAMDIYSTEINTVLNTFMVGKMNTGVVNLGKFLAYKVLFEDNRLRVFTTQQMYTYDYKAVQDMGSNILVYGWQCVDTYIPPRGSAYMLLARISQISGKQNAISEVRILSGSSDRRYTLPSVCIGAAIQEHTIRAFAPNALYSADVDQQRFRSVDVTLPNDGQIEKFFGLTGGGRAIVGSGSRVYTILLPSN